MKKFVVSMFVIIIICGIILCLKVMNNGENSNKYSRADVNTLMNKGKDYDNYYCEYTQLGENTIRKIRGNKMVVVSDDMTIYIDYSSNKQTVLKNAGNIAIVSNLNSSKLIKMNKIYFQECIDALNDYENYEYKFLKKERINDFECIKITLTSKSSDYEIWIDISSGLVTQMSYNAEGNSKITIEYNLKLNSIKEEEVKTPDLSKYKITQI